MEVRQDAPPTNPAVEAVFGGERMVAETEGVEKAEWDESEHPRDEGGKFSESGSGSPKLRAFLFEEPTPASPTPDEGRGVDGKLRLGDCFRQGGKYMLEHPGSELVHGTVDIGGPGGRGPHAWAEVRRPGGAELVYDGVQGKFYDKASYYRAFRAEPERTYTQDEARLQMLRTRHWGPWH